MNNIVQILSAYIDADGDVVALTKDGCYIYKYKLIEPEKLLARLSKKLEIDLEHWKKEFDFVDAGQGNKQ